MSKKYSINDERTFKFLVILIWIDSILLQYIRAVIMRIPIFGEIPDLLIAVVYILTIFLSLHFIKFSGIDIVILIFVYIIYLVEMFVCSESQQYINEYVYLFLIKAFPLYFVGLNIFRIQSKEKFLFFLYKLSIVTLILNIAYNVFYSGGMSEIASLYWGDMDLSYNILPHCCMIAYYGIRKTNIINIILSGLSFFYLFMLGTRGAALLFILFLFVVYQIENFSIKKVLITGLILITMFWFINSVYYEATLLYLSSQASRFGLSIRIFDKLLSNDAFVSNERIEIRNLVLSEAIKYPILGKGLCFDRVLTGTYSHNLIVELWIEFGFVFGSFVFIIMTFFIFNCFRKCRNYFELGLVLSLIFSNYFKLFLSGTYLSESFLFLLIGISVFSFRREKTEGES